MCCSHVFILKYYLREHWNEVREKEQRGYLKPAWGGGLEGRSQEERVVFEVMLFSPVENCP